MKIITAKLCNDPIRIIPIAILLPVLFSSASCKNNKEELLYPAGNTPPTCATVAAKFSTDVQPLVLTKCAVAGCHNATAAGGLTLQTHAQISAAKLRIETRVIVQKSMPPAGPLLPAEINILKCWIDGGAIDN